MADGAAHVTDSLVDGAGESHESLTSAGFFVALIFYRLESTVVQEIEGFVFEGQLIVDYGLIHFDPLKDRAIGIGGQAMAPDIHAFSSHLAAFPQPASNPEQGINPEFIRVIPGIQDVVVNLILPIQHHERQEIGDDAGFGVEFEIAQRVVCFG